MALTLACSLLAGGCVMHAPNLNRTRLEIERRLPGARFDREIEMTVGRISLGLARRFAGDEEGLAILRDLERAEIGIYEARALPALRQAGGAISFADLLEGRGWQTFVRIAGDDSVVQILFRSRRGSMRELFIGSLDHDELVLVRLRGDIQGLVDRLQTEGILDVPGVVFADIDPPDGKPIVSVEASAAGEALPPGP